MNYELSVYVCDKMRKVFLQSGFFQTSVFSNTLHRHRYGEVHTIAAGSVTLELDGKKTELCAGDVAYIPRNLFHSLTNTSSDARRIAFQCDFVFDELTVKRASVDVLKAFDKAICKYDGDSTLISSYISLVLSHFKEGQKFLPIVDREFLVWEFFANSYDKDVCVENLAAELNLSKKQTCRIVENITGNSFTEELTKRRTEAAKRLEKTTDMTMAEIASRVGYKSYSGFYKAYKSYKE